MKALGSPHRARGSVWRSIRSSARRSLVWDGSDRRYPMAVLNCVCGQRIEAGHDEKLFAALRRHSDAAHADQKIGDQELRDAIAATRRRPEWDGSAITLDEPPEIRELTP